MGTRNLTMVVLDGETKIAQYGQWDGYPEGQGSTILKTLRRIDAGAEWGRFKDRIKSLNWLTPEQGKEIEKDEQFDVTYPYLSRDCGGQILDAVYFGEMKVRTEGAKKSISVSIIGLDNKEEFAAGSLFCEWAYLIDLDKSTFEVYKGFNTTPLVEGDRFYRLQEKEQQEKYYPVRLVKSFDLTSLPSLKEFTEVFKNAEVEE